MAGSGLRMIFSRFCLSKIRYKLFWGFIFCYIWPKVDGRLLERLRVKMLLRSEEYAMFTKRWLKNKPICKVRFKLSPEDVKGAEKVTIVGAFNDWNPDSHPMKRAKDGVFSLELDLSIGASYQFRYRLNGEEWCNDPQADGYVYCNFAGTDNSVVNV